MNIIIEGPDASGKTTLAKEFEKHGFTYKKCSPGEHAEKSNLNYNYFSSLLKDNNCVFDRFFISELVFSEQYSREPVISFEEVNSLVSANLDNTILIFLYASDTNTLKKRLEERNEVEYLSEIDEQNKLFMKYAWIFSAYESKNIYLVNITNHDSLDEVTKIADYIIGGLQ